MTSDNQNNKLIPTTQVSSGPAMRAGEETAQAKSRRLKSSAAIAASALLSTSLLLSACGTDDDCIPTTAPANTNSSFILPAPPSSAQFTTGTTNPTNQTYCRSRRTGVFFWYVGSTGSYNSGGVGASS